MGGFSEYESPRGFYGQGYFIKSSKMQPFELPEWIMKCHFLQHAGRLNRR